MFEEDEQELINNSMYTTYVGVSFKNTQKAYYFGVENIELKLGDKVVVDTTRGLEIGEVTVEPSPMEKYTSKLGLKPVVRLATDVDLRMQLMNEKDAIYSSDICKKEIERLGLDMNLISCEYTLDKSKVLFSYLADERVDFRELLKSLASKLHARIELRQIGSRDKAKMVGGIGMCGLPLCCSTFLNEFDGISIGRAKNQMLAINIPKLSGQCGKLICCLKFEDEAYSLKKKEYPELGSKIFLDKVEYTVTSVNVLSGVIKIENGEDVKFMPYADILKQTSPSQKLPPIEEKPVQPIFKDFQFKERNFQNDNRNNQNRENQNNQNNFVNRDNRQNSNQNNNNGNGNNRNNHFHGKHHNNFHKNNNQNNGGFKGNNQNNNNGKN